MANEPLRQAKAELWSASRAIDAMTAATTMDEFEAEWREFLSCLEKVWTKTERTCAPHQAQFQPWQGKFHALRRKDMLLRYLKHARDADNHTIQDLAKLEPAYTVYDFVGPKGGYIEHLHLDAKEGLVAYKGDPVTATVIPPRPVAIAVETCGQRYNPPTMHLGKAVDDLSPINLAKLGLSFYSDFVHQVEKKFFSREP